MIERHPPLRVLASRKSPSGNRSRARSKVGAACAVEAIAIETNGVISSGKPEGC